MRLKAFEVKKHVGHTVFLQNDNNEPGQRKMVPEIGVTASTAA